MESITFYVPGKVMGKGRPRFTKRGFAFTPATTVNYENLVKMYFHEKAVITGWKLKESEEITVKITAFYEIPKSMSKKSYRLLLETGARPTKKPDWDNIGKIVCDSLNGIAYHDDAQIVRATVIKTYAGEPGLMVEISVNEEI